MADRKARNRMMGRGGTRQANLRRSASGHTVARHIPPASAETQVLAFGRKNRILLGSGILVVVVGFALLAVGDITMAPILLLAGYLVLIPMGLVAGSFREDEGEETVAKKGGRVEHQPGSP